MSANDTLKTVYACPPACFALNTFPYFSKQISIFRFSLRSILLSVVTSVNKSESLFTVATILFFFAFLFFFTQPASAQ